MEKIAVLIPAHNEEKVIEETIKSVIPLVGGNNVYVVNDGSTDKTGRVARKLVKNVLNLKNGGKANALNIAINYFSLSDKYEFIMPIDADTIISKNFFKDSLPLFNKDKKIVCIVGKVIGRNINWITKYRSLEYEINQSIHKLAQSRINGVTVCPGPATIYRSSVFKKISYSKLTLTEDMDLTFDIHRKKVGKIVYLPKISVSTQDPKTIKSYLKQIIRWYTGFWQCLVKNNIPFGGQALDFQAALMANDGLMNLIFLITYLISIPLLLKTKPFFVFVPPLIDFLVFMLPMVIYGAIKQNNFKLLLLLPHFYFLRILSSIIFIYSFFRVILGIDRAKKDGWQTERYQIERRKIWAI